MRQPSIDSETVRRLELFAFITLLAPAEILTQIDTPEALSEKIRTYTCENAKTYYLANCLLELQQSGFSFRRWNDFIKKIQNSKSDRFTEFEISSLTMDVNAWQRKLTEILVRIICFSSTNLEIYYYHYLLIEELVKTIHDNTEQSDNFNYDSKILLYRRHELELEIKKTEQYQGFNIDKCWYLLERKPLNSRKQIKAGGLLSGLKGMIRLAFEAASPFEKRALGFMYQYAFSHSSETLHFVPLPSNLKRDLRRLMADVSRISLMAVSISARCQQLLNIFPSAFASQQVIHASRTNVDLRHPFEKNAAVGDFVIVVSSAKPFLAEVMEIKENTSGYAIYRVDFLHQTPIPNVSADWIISNRCSIFMKREELMIQVMQGLHESLAHVDEKTRQQILDPKNIALACRDAVTTVWREANLREFFLAQIEENNQLKASDSSDVPE